MAATTTQAAPKPSKKKATKALERTQSPVPSTGSGPADKAVESHEEFETPYIKELHKNIRNANKKLAAASKTDAILAQHPGKSLDNLVADRIINADQKAQILKKPALQAQIAQFEEQLAQYQKVHEQYQAKAAADKAEWEKTLDKAKEDAAKEAKEEALASLKDSLLTLSEFLRLAAYRREEAKDPESDESQAIEGVLLAIYSGDQNAVSAMLKLIDGSSDQIISVPGEQLQTTYAAVATLAKTYQGPQLSEGAQEPEAQAAADLPTEAAAVDAVVADDGPDNVSSINEQSAADVITNGHANSTAVEDTTATGESSYDSSLTKEDTSISQEWVDVASPKESTEAEPAAEVVVEVSDAAEAKKQFWADDHPETTEAATTPDANDGFHQVQRNRGRQDREGGERGQGRGRGRGEWRGRGGHRGDGRGRGRGNRGGAGAPSRPPRRTEES
ncbi:hypothetical protein ESCO_002178 [Escovopsis weberi]|uniref:YAG7-like dimerisation domain-containing protein n=1 Tax=Escovopsis weberi TaxID=150374 RepID=A0A0M8N2I1_ESCWE|nr:hypothetical protein ESCO_002178 [Escovopsis weberi]